MFPFIGRPGFECLNVKFCNLVLNQISKQCDMNDMIISGVAMKVVYLY